MTPFRTILFAVALAVTGNLRAESPSEPANKPAATLPVAASLVRVNSTNQAFNFVKPWSKRPPFTRRGIGVVIDNARVLVTAELIANHSYVELERPASSEKIAAEVERVDYESNLAILKPQDPKFLSGARPVQLAKDVQVGSEVNVVQLENTGAVALTPGVVTTITVAPYPADGVALLAYRLTAPLQYRDNSFTMPVFAGDRLAGLLMRYDTRSQSADLVPGAVISSFLARAARQPYTGFPRAGIAFAPTRDPQFRRYLGMTGGQTGVYVVSVAHGSPAEKSGLKKGDVVMRVDGSDIDEDGNYTHPDYGKIPFSYLVSTASLPGGELPIRVLRNGGVIDLTLPLEPRDPSTILSESAIVDRAPRYYILGGLVFQELSRSYLREWGGDWRNNAPARLVYLDEFQDELPSDRGKIVFLSQVLPADTTVGYEDVGANVVERINGLPIRSLEDVAEAAKHPLNGFHKIELEADPGVLYLDAAEVGRTAGQLRSSYGLPAVENLSDPATKAH
ncbi:MAG: PDZ domain-containing protein [Terrimicrobiaceae bacterium]|nr:PDZ domain-containing protein [Terrimicrobiaceae bacterium]